MGFQLGGGGGSVGRAVSAASPCSAGRVALIVEAIELERGEERRDVAPRGDDARLVRPLEHARDDERRKNAEYHDDDQHLDQREAGIEPVASRSSDHPPIIIRRSAVPRRRTSASFTHVPNAPPPCPRRGRARRRGSRRCRRDRLVDPPAAAAADFAVRLRRETRREPQVGRTRACRRRSAADRVPARGACPLPRGRPVDQGGELRDRRGHHVAAAARQADAGRRHADGADGHRRQHVRRARRGAHGRIRRS